MKAFGYKKKEVANGLLELKEITISANHNEIKKMADFLLKCVSEMEKRPYSWDHEHFKIEGKSTPEFIIHNAMVRN